MIIILAYKRENMNILLIKNLKIPDVFFVSILLYKDENFPLRGQHS